MNHDPELQSLIRQWTAPDPATDLDARMMARFRARRRPFWKRRWELRVSIPAPALAGLLMLLLAYASWLASEGFSRASFRDGMGGFEPVAAPQLVTEVRP